MSSPDHSSESLARMRESLLSEFESILQTQPGLEAADRDSMLSRLQGALEDPSALETPVDPSRLQASVEETIGLMQQNGLLDASEAGEAHTAFAGSLATLQNESVQRALEFARISREQGEDAARSWLATQTEAASSTAASDAAPGGMPHHVAAALRQGAGFRR